MKKFLTVAFLSSVFAFSMNNFANAEDSEYSKNLEDLGGVVYEVQENIGLTEEPPQQIEAGAITPYTMQKPSNVWNLYSQGRYSFSGVTVNNPLYTNFLFTGKKTVKLYVKNDSSTYDLDVSFKEKKLLADSQKWGIHIIPGGSVTVTLTLDSSANYYLVAQPQAKFSGYIE